MSLFPQILANGVIAGATYAIIAMGFNLTYGATRFINMAYGAVAAVGGYLFYFVTREEGLPLVIGLVVGILGAGVVGVACDRLVFSPLRARRASEKVLFLASLGLFTMLQAIISMGFGTAFRPLADSSVSTTVVNVGSASVTLVEVVIIILAVAVYGALFVVLKRTTFGRAVRAVQDDEEVARMLGINTDRIIMQLFFISSCIAGLAGILVGFDAGLGQGTSLLILVEGAVASIIGGIGIFSGGMIGAFILGLVENFGIWGVGGEWKPAITFAALTLFLLVRPKGIFKN